MIENYINTQNWNKAFTIAKTHKVSIPKDNMRDIEIAAECIKGKSGFYNSLGIDTGGTVIKAKEFLISKYIK